MDKDTQELQKKVELGFKASQFLEDDFGQTVMEYWESCARGLNDVGSVKKDTAEQALAELVGRELTLNYIAGFKIYLQGLVDDGKFALAEIKRLENAEDFVKRDGI